MRNIRIVFMGTPEFAVTILKKIVEEKYIVVGVITAPDKPAGRGRKINQSAVKKFCIANDLKVLQPTNLKNEDFLADLKELNANLQVVVAFRMLPKTVWDMPEYGTFNLHASLLPAYRGAAPINWAIINGETKTGVSTFFIDEKIDTGKIILQKECIINPNETAGELHDKLMYLGSDLVVETIAQIKNNKVTTNPQPDRELKSAPKLFKENCEINWIDSLSNIYNRIRGLSPYPVAWGVILIGNENLSVKIFKANKQIEKHAYIAGTAIYSKKELKIAVKEGYLIIKELQIAGKRKMDVISFLNGYKFK